MGFSSTKLERLDEGLGKADRYLIISLGVVRKIKTGWRYLPTAFCGMGLFDLATETTAVTLNLFLKHYNMPTQLGVTLTTSLENLQIKLGVPDSLLLATDSWIKSLWQKIDAYDLQVDIKYDSIATPRERDKPIIQDVIAAGLSGHRLIQFNRVQKS